MIPDTARQILSKYKRLSPCKNKDHVHTLFYYPGNPSDIVEDALTCLHIPFIRLEPEKHKLTPTLSYFICLECLDKSSFTHQLQQADREYRQQPQEIMQEADDPFEMKPLSKEEALKIIPIMD